MKKFLLPLGTAFLASAPRWAQCETVRITTDGETSVRFGNAVACDGEWVVVGDFQDDTFGSLAGAAHVFRKDGLNWFQAGKLTASNATRGSYFSDQAVDISGTTIVVGARFGRQVLGGHGGGAAPAPGTKFNPAGTATGTAYVFDLIDGAWVETARLVSANPSGGAQFGASVAIQGDTLLIGAPRSDGGGSVHVFQRTEATWTATQVLRADVPVDSTLFGRFVSISGDRLIVGAPVAPAGPEPDGRAYVFTRSAGKWTQEAELVSDGWAVSLDGDTAVIGSRFANRVTVFERQGLAWPFVASLTGNNLRFGFDVAVEGDRILVGTLEDVEVPHWRSYPGMAFTFQRIAGVWTETGTLQASDANPLDQFGCSLALDGGMALIGAPSEGDRGGAAYTFSMEGSECATLTTSTGTSTTDARISLAAGGVQIMQLDAGAEQAGRNYWVGGTTSGTSPGFMLAGLRIPVNPDPYFTATVAHANQGFFTNNLGLLDDQGRASVTLALPPGLDPVLAGMVLNHAYVVFDETLGLTHVSNITSLFLAP